MICPSEQLYGRVVPEIGTKMSVAVSLIARSLVISGKSSQLYARSGAKLSQAHRQLQEAWRTDSKLIIIIQQIWTYWELT